MTDLTELYDQFTGIRRPVGPCQDPERDAPQLTTVTTKENCNICGEVIQPHITAIRWEVGGKTFYRHNCDCLSRPSV